MRNFLTIVVLVSVATLYPLIAQQAAQTSGTQAIAGPSTAATPNASAVNNEADPLMDLPPLPKDNVSLVAGKVVGVDRVRNRLAVEAFGGKKMKFAFDERTHIYRDGVETTQLGIRKGDRVYVDTQLVGTTVFARNIRIGNAPVPADAQGQIESYDPNRGVLVLRDSLSSEPVSFRVSPSTVVRGKASSLSEVREGALVSLKFVPGTGRDGVVQEVTVTARPGETFTFVGKVIFLDMSAGKLAVQNQTDNKTYDIEFDPARGGYDKLGVGADVNVTAQFDGSNYVARQITVMQAKEAQARP